MPHKAPKIAINFESMSRLFTVCSTERFDNSRKARSPPLLSSLSVFTLEGGVNGFAKNIGNFVGNHAIWWQAKLKSHIGSLGGPRHWREQMFGIFFKNRPSIHGATNEGAPGASCSTRAPHRGCPAGPLAFAVPPARVPMAGEPHVHKLQRSGAEKNRPSRAETQTCHSCSWAVLIFYGNAKWRFPAIFFKTPTPSSRGVISFRPCL